jgi:hypothetical protein
MWGLSVQFWQSVVLWANIVALLGAVLTGAALYVSAKVSSNIADVIQEDADKRITEARTRGDEARAEAAKANQRAQEAAERAAEAELRLEQLRKQVGPRQILRDAFLSALADQPKAPTEIFFLRDDPDSFFVAQQIRELLHDANWEVTQPAPASPSDLYPTSPTVMSVGGQPSGITVVGHSVSHEEGQWWMDKMSGKEWPKTPWTVLSNAFSQSLGSVAGSGGGANAPPEGRLRVVVAPRQ